MALLDSIRSAIKSVTGLGKASPMGREDAALAKYETDLNLQNLLVLGAEFKPDDITDLRRRARFGDPRYLYALYDEMFRLGPAPQIAKMREALKGTETRWKTTPEDYDDEEAEESEAKAARLIRDVAEEAWGEWLRDIKSHHATKHVYGIMGMQIIVDPRGIENRWERVIDILPIPARRFRLDQQTRKFLFLPQPTSWTGIPVDDLVAKGQLFFAETGREVEPLDQRGLMAQCLIPWAIHQYIVRWRAKRLEVYGLPPRIVSYASGDPTARGLAEEVAKALGAVSWAAIPDTMKAELLQTPTGRGADPYESAIEWCVRCYDQIFLGHSQASGVQVGAGSRTSTEAATEMAKDLINSRATEFDEDFHHGPLFLYTRRNFGKDWADSSTPKTESTVIERDDAETLAGVAVALKNAGAGGVIAAEDLVARCSVKIADDGEMTLAGMVKGMEPPPGQMVPGMFPGQQAGGPIPPELQGQQPGPPGGFPPKGLPPGGGGAVPPGQPGEKPMLPAAKGGEAQQPDSASARENVKEDGEKPGLPPKKNGKQTMAGLVGVGAMPAAFPLALSRKKKRELIAARRQRFAAAGSVARPRVTLCSFGHSRGIPEGMDALIDVRGMESIEKGNPALTGTDPGIARMLEEAPRNHQVFSAVRLNAKRAISAAQLSGKQACSIGLGCEHGRHRSVYVAERLGRELRADGYDATVTHRDAFVHAELVNRLPGARQSFAGEWNEEDHPRDENNQKWVEKGAEGSGGGKGDGKGGTEKWETEKDVGWQEKGAKVKEEVPFPGPFPEAARAWDQPVDDAGRPIPIKVKTVEEAIPLVLQGKVVELPEIRSVNTLVDKLAEMIDNAKARGEEIPNYDLCNVTVAGTNLFCAETLNYERIVMPQLAGTPMPGSEASKLAFTPGTKEVDAGPAFIESLKKLGYKVEDVSVRAASLKATQNQLVGATVGGIMRAAETNRTIIDTPIFITKDNYIVDGHHRWAAVVALDSAKNKFQIKMNVHRINANITEILHLANRWSKWFGIKQKSGATRGKMGAQQRFWDEDQPRDENGRWTEGGGGGGAQGRGIAYRDTSAGLRDTAVWLEDALIADEGFTYQPSGETFPHEGYAVSIRPENEKVLERGEVTAFAIADYMRANEKLLADPQNHVGAWLDRKTGKVYLDIATVVESSGEAERLGREHKQKAYYDLKRHATVYISEVKRAVHSFVEGAIRAAGLQARHERGGDRPGAEGSAREAFAPTEAERVAAADFEQRRRRHLDSIEDRITKRVLARLSQQKRAALPADA